MGRYRKLLVAVDGSETSMHALKESFKLANSEQCWITVVSVIPPYEGDLDLTVIKDIRASLRKPCETALAEAQKIADKERAMIKTVCEEGEVYKKILEVADYENVNIIIMGNRGLSRIDKILIGSTTARVIGHSNRDILIVPHGTSTEWKNILLATDGSIYSKAAAIKAIDFAKSYGGHLNAISVVDVPPEFYAEAPNAADDLIKKSKGYVADIKQIAVSENVPASTFVGEGEAYELITKLARKNKSDIIIMGSHGRTGLKRLLIGSVAEKVIGYAPCPVLIVKS